MGTRADTVDFLLDQLSTLPNLRTRKMFGEYALYCDDKVVAFVCDDELFIKPTSEGHEFVEAAGALDEAPAYPGSKLYFRISGDRWEDRDWLTSLVALTASVVPPPAPKRSKSRAKAKPGTSPKPKQPRKRLTPKTGPEPVE